MHKRKLIQLYLLTALALCAPPLLGMENSHNSNDWDIHSWCLALHEWLTQSYSQVSPHSPMDPQSIPTLIEPIPESDQAFGQLRKCKENESLFAYKIFLLNHAPANLIPVFVFPKDLTTYIGRIFICLNRIECSINLRSSSINDNQLTLFPMFFVTEVQLGFNRSITGSGLVTFPNLTSLYLRENTMITDAVLMLLPNLTDLNLMRNNKITDEGIMCLTKLTRLVLAYNENITKKGIESLINLTSLNIEANQKLEDEELIPLTKLTILNLKNNKIISNQSIQRCTNLTSLYLSYLGQISYETIIGLPNLRLLVLFDGVDKQVFPPRIKVIRGEMCTGMYASR